MSEEELDLSELAADVTPTSDWTKVLAGGGIGALLGGGASAYMASRNEDKDEDKKQRRKRIVRQALLGSAAGGGVGAGIAGLGMIGPGDKNSPDRKTHNLFDRANDANKGNILSNILDVRDGASEAVGFWNPWNLGGLTSGNFEDSGYYDGFGQSALAASALPLGLHGFFGGNKNPHGIGNVSRNAILQDLHSKFDTGGHVGRSKLLNAISQNSKGFLKNPNDLRKLLTGYRYGGSPITPGLEALHANLRNGPGGLSSGQALDRALNAMHAGGVSKADIKAQLAASGLGDKTNKLSRFAERFRTVGPSNTLKGMGRSMLSRPFRGLAGFTAPLFAANALRATMPGDNGLTSAENYDDLKQYVKVLAHKQLGSSKEEITEQLRQIQLTDGRSPEQFMSDMKELTGPDGMYSGTQVKSLIEKHMDTIR